MVVSLKKGFAAIALAIVLLASGMFGLLMHVNAAVPQHQARTSIGMLAHVGQNFVCPPPPYDCM